MEFKNPPVIEAWTEFTLELPDETVAWDKNSAVDFINNCCHGFKPSDFLIQQQVMIDAHSRSDPKLKITFERIRAFDEGKENCIQAGQKILIFNQIRRTSWPGFSALRDRSLDTLCKFIDFRKLNKLGSVALHYRDLVEIPFDQNNAIDPKNYFRIYPHCPETIFEDMSYYSLRIVLNAISAREKVLLEIQTVPGNETNVGTGKFQFDWHIKTESKCDDMDTARCWLDNAHADLEKTFKNLFTEKCLALFQPEDKHDTV